MDRVVERIPVFQREEPERFRGVVETMPGCVLRRHCADVATLFLNLLVGRINHDAMEDAQVSTAVFSPGVLRGQVGNRVGGGHAD